MKRKLSLSSPLAIFCSFLASCLLLFAEITPEQQLNTFNASTQITKLSYHWDSFSGGVPVVATTPRSLLPSASSLATIAWNPALPDLYQQKTIGSTSYNCTLVGTFTKPNSFWDAPPGTEKHLTYDSSGTTHYISTWVTSGDSLKNYLLSHYFDPVEPPPSSSDASLRISQSLGLKPLQMDLKGLAFFWVPIENLARPAYSQDISTQLPSLSTWPDGTYQSTSLGSPLGFNYVDYGNDTILYTGPSGAESFIEYTQAQTSYPWTSMGYTYNWNALQDGSNPSYGSDPHHISSPIGLSEFLVSSDTSILLDQWIPYSELGYWIVPEPSAFFLFFFSFILFLFFSPSRLPALSPTPPPTQLSSPQATEKFIASQPWFLSLCASLPRGVTASLFAYDDRDNPDSYCLEIRENHAPSSGYDPATSPRIGIFLIAKNSRSIRYLDPISGDFLPIDSFLKERKIPSSPPSPSQK